MKKYELLKENTIIHNGVTLYQIVATRDFGTNVEMGELGGWVENETNLSHYGDCWITDNAKVYGKAKVKKNAIISGSAEIKDAEITDYVKIGGYVKVHGGLISGWSEINGEVVISGNVHIYEHATIYGQASISGYSKITGTVGDNAIVRGLAYISNNAKILGDAVIERTDQYIVIEPVSPIGDTLTIIPDQDIICTEDFKGTKKEFINAVIERHGNDKRSKRYIAIVEFVYVNWLKNLSE